MSGDISDTLPWVSITTSACSLQKVYQDCRSEFLDFYIDEIDD